MLDKEQLLQQRYKIVKILGRGGMGAVYLAEDQRLPTKWAVKEMKKEGLTEEERAEGVELFKSEARILSELRHRNLPRIVDFFEQDAQLYLVMDYVEGITLEQLLSENGPLPTQKALEMCLQIADVLDYLHSRKDPIVFRDFKPGNVMVTEQNEVKLVDFGIARVFKQDASADTKALGTPGYAAPEQYGRGQSGPRTDLYAFGATMHHALTGRDPTDEPFQFPPLTDYRQDLPQEFVGILEACLALKTHERPESAFAVKKVLEPLLGITGSAALTTGRRTTSELGQSPAPEAPLTEGGAPTPAPTVPAVAPASPPALNMSFSPKALKVKELAHGDKATLRLKVKSDRAVDLVCDSSYVTIFPSQVSPGVTTCTVTLDSSQMEKGTLFKEAIEAADNDEFSVPIEAQIIEPKASASRSLSMWLLMLCALVPVLNYGATLVGAIVIFSTPKPKRPSIKIPWRLNLLFSSCWTAFFGAVAFGLSKLDWTGITTQFHQWTSSF